MPKDLLPFLLSPLFLFFAPMMALSMFTMSAVQAGSFQRRTSRKQWAFSLPDAVPVFLVSLFVFIAAMCLAIANSNIFQAIPATLDWQYVRTHSTWQMMGIGLIIAFLYWSVLSWWHKKYVLVLDLDRRSYRTLDMSKVLPTVRTGAWDEIAGIAIRRASAKGSTTYHVVLKWRKASHFYSTLGRFSQADKAAAYAKKLSDELHLPLVASV